MHKMLNFLEHHDRITVIMRLTCKKGSRPSHPLILTTCKLWFFPKALTYKTLQKAATTCRNTQNDRGFSSKMQLFNNI